MSLYIDIFSSTERLLSVDKSLKQLLTTPTTGPNILTVYCSDMQAYYEEPIIVPPIAVDVPGKGVPSDHQGVVMNPRHVSNVPVKRKKIVRTIRPITSSDIHSLGQVLTRQ